MRRITLGLLLAAGLALPALTIGSGPAGAACSVRDLGCHPDLVAARIAGAQDVIGGRSEAYEVVVRNDGGAVTGEVTVALAVNGALGAETLEAPEGFSCIGRTAYTCTGTLGSSATFRVRARAEAKGRGYIVATVNPDRTLVEQDYANNLRVLDVTVR